MANQLNLNGIVISDDDFLAKDQDVPDNTSVDGNGGSFDIGNFQEGSLEVVANVGSVGLDISDTFAITIKIQDSADNSSFADLANVYTLTASSGNGVKAIGTLLGKLILPSATRRYIKAVIVTTDASASGKVNVFLTYLPR
jgi:hypothetical protein